MRASGVLVVPRELASGDHLCWIFEDDDAFARDVVTFLRDGLLRGERIAFTGGPDTVPADRVLAPLGDIDGLVRDGVLEISTLGDLYAQGITDPVAQVRAYADATERALADGFSGLRIAADATALVRDAAHRSAFCDYEHLVDAYMSEHPFAAMCAYDRRVLGDAVDELACLHPAGNHADLRFRCHAAAGGELRVCGEVDVTVAPAFEAALRHVTFVRPSHLRVDARDLTFIDHRGMLALRAAADSVEVVTRFSGASRLAGLLGLTGLTVLVEA